MDTSRWYRIGWPALLFVCLVSCRRAEPADPLAGTVWVAVECLGQKPAVGTTLTLAFETGQVRGSSGCNTYFGSYRVSGSRIEMDQLASTKIACQGPGVMQQEGAFLASLGEVDTYQLDNGRLKLVRSDGQTIIFQSGE